MNQAMQFEMTYYISMIRFWLGLDEKKIIATMAINLNKSNATLQMFWVSDSKLLFINHCIVMCVYLVFHQIWSI